MIYQSLHDWFQSPLGAYLLAREEAWLDEVTPDIFGFHAIQLGLPQVDLLRESRIAHRLTVTPEVAPKSDDRQYVRAEFHELPFDAQSVDLCVIPHVLEFSENPHEVLREIDRVLRPEGRLLVLGFNPWSLFGTRKLWSSEGYPWQGQFVSLVRIKDWLQLLGLEPASGQLACYIPPVDTEKWQRRFGFMERTGDRWWGVGGGVYMLEAIKHVAAMRLIAPMWKDKKLRERKFATAARYKGCGNSQCPVSGCTGGRIASLFLTCVACHAARVTPSTASRQHTHKRDIDNFRIPNRAENNKHLSGMSRRAGHLHVVK